MKGHYDNLLLLVTAFFVFLLLLFFFIITIAIRYRKRKKENLEMALQFQQELLTAKMEIQEHTLTTISEEIHDNIGQVLSLAKLNLNTFPPNDDPVAQVKLADTRQLVSKAITDLRDLSRSLHGDKIADEGLQEAISNELRLLQNTKQYITSLVISGQPYKLETQNQVILFRITQEALHNIVKHAKAKKITVNLSYDPGAFTLSVADDGIGFDQEGLLSRDSGIGLKSIRNRAGMIGGEVSINSVKDRGTVITVHLKNAGLLN